MAIPAGEQKVAPHPLRQAVEARDLDALIASFTPDVVLHSPLISEPFQGREEVAYLFTQLAEVLFSDDFHYTAELAEGDTVILAFKTKVKGVPLEGVDILRLNDEGKIDDITILLRPLTGAAATASFLAPRLAGRDNKLKAFFAGLGTRPLSGMARLFDAIGSRDVRSRS
jgi:predicted SnoaL-like aldol condensation-catalyzing enzyme